MVVASGLEDGRVWVELEDTIFYPEGGGQPADRGNIGDATVVDVQKIDDRIRHYLSEAGVAAPDAIAVVGVVAMTDADLAAPCLGVAPRGGTGRRTEESVKRIAVYPGTFDPVTNGHLDLVDRGRKHFDQLVIGVLHNDEKQPLFSVDQRVELEHLVDVGPRL